MLTGKKCNFCTYIVTGAPNGPPIQGEWGKVQFLHLHCNWCSKWSPYTGWLAQSEISAPTLSVVLLMVPLYRVIGEKCNFCTYIVTGAPNGPPIHGDWGKVQFLHLHCQWCSKWSTYTGWLEKSAISAPTLLLVLQMVPLYRVIGEKCNFCTYFVTGAPNGPLYMLTGGKCNFCTYIALSNVHRPPIQADWGRVQFLHLLCYWCSKWSTKNADWQKVQFLHLHC